MPSFTSRDELRIAYEILGDGPAVILLHGFAASAQINWFDPGVAAALGAAGRQVIAPDTLGHGQSDKPHDDALYRLDGLVEDVCSLMDHLGLSSADVVGYSMGAATAVALGVTEPRVRSIVLGGVGAKMIDANGTQLDHEVIAAGLEVDDPSTITDPAARGFRVAADRTTNDRLALATAQRAMKDRALDLGAIPVSTLVLTGADDQLAGAPEPFAAQIPNPDLSVGPRGCGDG